MCLRCPDCKQKAIHTIATVVIKLGVFMYTDSVNSTNGKSFLGKMLVFILFFNLIKKNVALITKSVVIYKLCK